MLPEENWDLYIRILVALGSEFLEATCGFYFISLFLREEKLFSVTFLETKAQVNSFNYFKAGQEAE